MMKKLFIVPGFSLLLALGTFAQTPDATPTATATDEQAQKEKAALEKKALGLLDQLVADAASLKLPENRIRLQITTADLLWDRSEARARTLFTQAAESVTEMSRAAAAVEVNVNTDRRNGPPTRTSAQLRQELVMAIARHDAPMAYQVLATTRPLTSPVENPTGQIISADDTLEQALLARIALIDPKLALQNAEQFLEKDQYPRSLTSVLSQLQKKDKEAAEKLETKLVQRLQSTNMLANMDAGTLALTLLLGGPRPAPATTATTSDTPAPPVQRNSGQLLSESSYQDVMRTLVEAALRATPAAATQRGGNAGRARGPAVRGLTQQPQSDAELEQANARRLLNGVQALLPKIDQYLPERGQAVRQKMTEVGMNNNRGGFDMAQVALAMAKGDANSLETAASAAPPQLQNRIYQQAAMKALEEGNVDRAKSIADDHLEPNTRAMVTQAIDFRKMADKIETSRIEDIRLTLGGLSSDNQRIDLLLQLAAAAQKKNAKLSRQLLDEAQRLVSRPATSYQQMDAQIKVAHSLIALDPARAFQVLEPGIMQLNELLSAAAVLNGFELNVFREGELPLQANSGLGSMVNRYAQELAVLARTDFERAQTLVNRFQLSEPRIQARLAIAQGVLRPQLTQTADNSFGNNFGFGNAGGVFMPQIRIQQ
ncbi:MAG: hypothetical protein QOE77_1633 [Blastocatellia bacterium]|jgi:hypothetical protein|nr:hypothetical protein [Blastocatellia bacterium]